jgi:hypothetical protein
MPIVDGLPPQMRLAKSPPACAGKADIIVTMPTKKNGSSKVVGGAFVVLGKAEASWDSPYYKNIDSMTAAADGFSISVPEVPSFRLLSPVPPISPLILAFSSLESNSFRRLLFKFSVEGLVLSV